VPQRLAQWGALAATEHDAWFCSVPTQASPNRSFFHAPGPSGLGGNDDDSKSLLQQRHDESSIGCAGRHHRRCRNPQVNCASCSIAPAVQGAC